MKKDVFFSKGMLALSLCFLHTGCQQSAINTPTSADQVGQLSSLIAGGNYLREACGQNLPDEKTLIARALGLAESKKWNIHAAEYKKLSAIAMEKTQQISQDAQRKEEKCRKLEDSLFLFLHH